MTGCSAIGDHIPLSRSMRVNMKASIHGNIARFGLPTIWFTLNPSDLNHPLLCKIAGVDEVSLLNAQVSLAIFALWMIIENCDVEHLLKLL